MADNPFCVTAEDGFHCGHEIHRHVTIGLEPPTKLTAKCCWCNGLVEVTFTITKIAFPGHGMGCAHETEVWDLPVGWHQGDV